MLTLTRKVGESVRIGEDIVVVVKDIKGRQVRLGFKAPSDTFICREELYERIKEENIQAASRGVKEMESVADLLRRKK
jgi:carbon storage regulator